MLYMSHIPDKTDPGEAVPLLEVDGWRGVARLYPHHGGLHLGRRPEVVLPHLEPDSVIVKTQTTTSQPSAADPDSDPANAGQKGPDVQTYFMKSLIDLDGSGHFEKSDPVKKNWLASVMQRLSNPYYNI